MTTPSIPAGFVPVTSPSGYSFTGPGGVVRAEVEGGRSRQAMAFDRGEQTFSVALALSLTEFEVWTLFYHHIIKKGAISFTMPLDSGLGVATHTVTMLPGTYQAANSNGTTYIVTFQVAAEANAYDYETSAAELIVDAYESGTDLTALFAALAEFATVDSNVLDF